MFGSSIIMSKSKHKPPVQWRTYIRLLRYARPYLPRLLLGTVCGALFGGSMAGILAAARGVLGQVFQSSGFGVLMMLLGILLTFGFLRGVGQFFGDYFIEWVGNRVVMDLRVLTFTHMQNLSVRFFSLRKTGELISRTLNDSMMIERAVSSVLGDLVKQPFVLFGAIAYALYLDARLTLGMLVVFPLCIVPVALFGRRVRRYAKHGQERLAELVSIMQETISGIRIVKAFGMEAHEIERFRAQCHQFFNRIMRVTIAKAAIEPLIVFISMCGLALVLLYARWARMPAEDFITFALAAVVMYEPVKKLSKIHMYVQQTSAAADRIFEILDTPALIRDAAVTRPLVMPLRAVVFDRVCFEYEPGQAVLRDIDFSVNAGERIALVGASGAGKTSLVNLLPRFYDVTSGRVLINGVDLRELRLADLRRNIGLVTQDTFLFNDTVAANIAYGSGALSHDAIQAAARRAHAHDFIMQMPAGYDTVIGERGVCLSGGQRQRLAVARAILRNPPILILDEATSALDTESERLVQAAINEVMTGRTVFAVAHRLSTIIHCDKIIVLDQGRIVENGTHHELLAAAGAYKRLYEMQFNPD
jgi:subfamily B ATP-binding cassette protein MsbA